MTNRKTDSQTGRKKERIQMGRKKKEEDSKEARNFFYFSFFLLYKKPVTDVLLYEDYND